MAEQHTFRSPDHLRHAAIQAGIPRSRSSSTFRRRKDRHGRGPRGPRFHPALPAWSTRKEQFYEHVVEAVQEMAAREEAVAGIEFGIQEVPPSGPAEWETHDVVLARVFPRDRRRGLADRIVVYRQPIMARVLEEDLPVALRVLLAERICEVLDVYPEDLLS